MSDRITRRQFASSVASGSTLAAIGSCSAEDLPKTGSTVAEKPGEKLSTLELMTQIAKQELPHEKLDPTAMAEIRSDINSNLSRSKALSAFPLTNSDEPGFVFSAWRKDPVL